MSSTERAPEPTMEEILASIRRIISDDEANTAQRPTGSQHAQQARVDDAEYGAADTQMIEHLERALGGVAGPAANDDDADDILDLTDPGAGPEDVMMADEPVVIAEEVVEEIVLETEIYEEPRASVDFGAAFPPVEPAPGDMAERFSDVAEAYSTPEPTYPEPTYEESAPSFAAEQASGFVEETLIVAETFASEPSASEPPAAPQAEPAAEDPTTALERAIAALKAGDLAAFAREAQAGSPAAEPVYVPPASIYTLPEREAPAPESEAVSAALEPEPVIVAIEDEDAAFLSEPETTFEPTAPSWSAESPSWSAGSALTDEDAAEPEPEMELEVAPEPAPWRSEGMAWRGSPPANEFELNPPRVNGGRDHELHNYAVPGMKSLEDSVKEMLRPMLKQWLDENMPRVLTAALREELENSDMRRGS